MHEEETQKSLFTLVHTICLAASSNTLSKEQSVFNFFEELRILR